MSAQHHPAPVAAQYLWCVEWRLSPSVPWQVASLHKTIKLAGAAFARLGGNPRTARVRPV